MHIKVTKRQSFLDFYAEQEAKKSEAMEIYNFVCSQYRNAEAIYEDTIVNLVGEHGLCLLREFHLIETCAIFKGRKLCAI